MNLQKMRKKRQNDFYKVKKIGTDKASKKRLFRLFYFQQLNCKKN